MDAEYTPFHLMVWLTFFMAVVIVYMIVSCFHRMYPDYPESGEKRVQAPTIEDEADVFSRKVPSSPAKSSKKMLS